MGAANAIHRWIVRIMPPRFKEYVIRGAPRGSVLPLHGFDEPRDYFIHVPGFDEPRDRVVTLVSPHRSDSVISLYGSDGVPSLHGMDLEECTALQPLTHPPARAPKRTEVSLTPCQTEPSWDWVFLSLCMIAISVDPLFFYIPVINDDIKCLRLDNTLAVDAIVVRSLLDFSHLILIFSKLLAFNASSSFRYGKNCHLRLTARKYVLSVFPIDLLSILPLPQVVIFIASNRGMELPNAMNLLQYSVIFQYVPRLIRIYPLFKKVTRTSRKLDEATSTKAAFNLLLYLLASHLFGALWYFLAIEREIVCWKRADRYYLAGCNERSTHFNENLENYNFLHYLCPTKTPNTTAFDFGIYRDALQSGIVEVTDFPQKFLYSFLWGLQNLSCFGQNLETSPYAWENFFAILITITGLVFFLYLIGNIQIYLQSRTTRREEMRLKAREIEEWNGFRNLSAKLQRKVRKYRQYVWRETKGVDVENLLKSLPTDLRRNVKSELGLALLSSVPFFKEMGERFLSELCDCLKPVLYPEDCFIIRESYPVDMMLFVMKGRLSCVTTDGGRTRFYNAYYLGAGDYFGEVLISCARYPKYSTKLPISTRTVRTLTEVEGFALMTEDFKFVVSQLISPEHFNSKRLQHAFRYSSHQWRTRAACLVQYAWRRYTKKKLEESLLRAEENRLQDEWISHGRDSLSFYAASLAVIFAIKVRPALWYSQTKDGGEGSIQFASEASRATCIKRSICIK